jgi:hypothetical protein
MCTSLLHYSHRHHFYILVSKKPKTGLQWKTFFWKHEHLLWRIIYRERSTVKISPQLSFRIQVQNRIRAMII